MSLIQTVQQLKTKLDEYKGEAKTVGFVPTMGYLHEGHLSLIRKAKEDHNFVVVSIFVNPTQFAPGEDFEKYPRDIKRDYDMARSAGADVVFNPVVQEIYPDGASTQVEVVGSLTKKLCGLSRPNHFRGVTTVVNILLNIVRPNEAYFGQKDAQQALIIKKMIKDLGMQVKMTICPIVREVDGLAMSSRNAYLNSQERTQATVLYRSLQKAERLILEGLTDTKRVIQVVREEIETAPLACIEYVELLDANTLENMDRVETDALLAIAVRFGKTRLIDNKIIQIKESKSCF